MEEALRCAQRALEAGEVPVGAVVLSDGRMTRSRVAGTPVFEFERAGEAFHRFDAPDLFGKIVVQGPK
jgi:hypothetical protein